MDLNNYLNLISFALGSSIGSYLGNILEEKMALGCITIEFNTNKKDYDYFNEIFKNYKKNIIKTINNYKFEINIKRNKQNFIIKQVKKRNKSIKISIIKIFNC